MAKTRVSQSMADLSEERTEMPEYGAISNVLLVMSSMWAVAFDLKNGNLRCSKCRQSIIAIGKNGVGYMTTIQEIMGQVVMHMIQVHNYTREGTIENGE
jgi:hypothetical protein